MYMWHVSNTFEKRHLAAIFFLHFKNFHVQNVPKTTAKVFISSAHTILFPGMAGVDDFDVEDLLEEAYNKKPRSEEVENCIFSLS